MADPRVQRRLAAILAADVVGFSRLVGADEEGTLAALGAHRRELVDPTIARHRGRIVKTTGDGLLVEFASAVDAVACAIDLQQGMAERNAPIAQDRRIVLRIGINLGDVVIEGEDILGDGVNVAARLEAIAEPGGICISRAIHDQVRDRIARDFVDMGEQEVKNIARPVHVFRVGGTGEAPVVALGSAPALPDRPSIVVLAFENMSEDPEQGYFSDGIAEDIITDLSRVAGLFVIARNSAFAYKGKAVDVRKVSRELGVRYVLEGSVRKAGTRLRVTAQLIDGQTAGHLWAERYDRDLADIFAVQDELTREIVQALSIKLSGSQRRRVTRKGTTNLEAYDHYLRARELFSINALSPNPEIWAEIARAIDLDDKFALPHVIRAGLHIQAYANGWSDDPAESLQLALAEASRAVALDDQEPQAYWRLSSALLWLRQHDRSIQAAERAIALDPNFAEAYGNLGRALSYAGRPEEAIGHLGTAMRLDPHYHDILLHFLAEAYFQAGRYDEAIAVARRRIERNPATDITRVLLASCHGHLGDVAAARSAWADAKRINPNYSIELRRRTLPYRNPADFERIVEGLRRSGIAT